MMCVMWFISCCSQQCRKHCMSSHLRGSRPNRPKRVDAAMLMRNECCNRSRRWALGQNRMINGIGRTPSKVGTVISTERKLLHDEVCEYLQIPTKMAPTASSGKDAIKHGDEHGDWMLWRHDMVSQLRKKALHME